MLVTYLILSTLRVSVVFGRNKNKSFYNV